MSDVAGELPNRYRDDAVLKHEARKAGYSPKCVEQEFSEVGLGCLQDALGPMVSVMLPLEEEFSEIRNTNHRQK
jgi:hypothetical protein